MFGESLFVNEYVMTTSGYCACIVQLSIDGQLIFGRTNSRRASDTWPCRGITAALLGRAASIHDISDKMSIETACRACPRHVARSASVSLLQARIASLFITGWGGVFANFRVPLPVPLCHLSVPFSMSLPVSRLFSLLQV